MLASAFNVVVRRVAIACAVELNMTALETQVHERLPVVLNLVLESRLGLDACVKQMLMAALALWNESHPRSNSAVACGLPHLFEKALRCDQTAVLIRCQMH